MLYVAAAILVWAFGLARMWDYRMLEWNRVDTAWQLELVWLARHGSFSGRDFDYARGPLWQVIATLPTALFRSPSAATILAGMEAGFFALGAVIAGWVGLRRIRAGWPRIAGFLVLTGLSFGVGVSTFRALLSTAVVLSLVDRRPSFRGALAPAALTLVGLLVSFDRFFLALASVGTFAAYELFARYRTGDPKRPAFVRLGWYVLALASGLVALAVVALVLGADPARYFLGQREIAGGYGQLGAAWKAGVPLRNIVVFLMAVVGIATVFLLRRAKRWLFGAWIAASLPLASFAVVLPDHGHVYVALIPLVIVLWVVALSSEVERSSRVASGLVAGVFMLGWFGAHPADLRLAPWSLVRPVEALAGLRRGDAGFTSDTRAMAEWLARQPKPVRCIGASPDMVVLHPLTGIGGPTLLTLRWTENQRVALADKITEAACPYYMFHVSGFENPVGPAWNLGEDFLAIAESYRLAERIGPAAAVLAHREAPRKLEPRELSTPVAGKTLDWSVPGSVEIPLGAEIDGADLVRLDYTMELPRWFVLSGSLPTIEYRFEHRGAPVSDWVPFFHADAQRPTHAFLSSDPAATEAAFILGQSRESSARADTLRIRFKRRGRFAARAGKLTIHGISRYTAATAAAAGTASCAEQRDLAADLESGRAYARNTSPRAQGESFHLDSNQAPVENLPEIYEAFEPCASTCLSGIVELAPGQSDGAQFEVHVMEDPRRTRVMFEELTPGQTLPFELSLEPWQGRDILLRVGTWPGDSGHAEHDRVTVRRLAVRRCSARRTLAEATRQGLLRVVSGRVRPEGDELLLSGQVSYPFRAIADTCVELTAQAPDDGAARRLEAWIEADDVQLEILRQSLGTAQLTQYSLHDFIGRDVALGVSVTASERAAPVRLRARLYRCGT